MDFIHKFVPSEQPQQSTTLVLLHGTGGNEEDLLPLGRFLAPGISLLGVRGKVLEGAAPRYFRRLAEGVFDEADLIFRTHELARFLEQAAKEYSLDQNRLIAVGYSNGANIAASLLLLEPTVLSAAVLFRAMVPMEPEKLPSLSGKHVLLHPGRHDPIVPQQSSERLTEQLQQAGATVTTHWQNTGHGLVQSEFEIARVWLRENLLK